MPQMVMCFIGAKIGTFDKSKGLEMAQTIRNLVLVAFLVVNLMACDEADRNAKKEVDRGLLEAVEKAKLITDPWVAFQALDANAAESLTAEGLCKRGVSCRLTEAQSNVIDYHAQLLAKSVVEAKEPQAFLQLYRMRPTKDSAYFVLQESASSLLFEFVDLAADGPTTFDIIQIAGDYLVNGPEQIYDLSKAIEYYARAWRKGDSRSASAAATALVKAKDFPNAYLWALRCIMPCTLSGESQVEVIKATIPAAEQKTIESQAGNSRVVMIK
jgi:hypothetical protein